MEVKSPEQLAITVSNLSGFKWTKKKQDAALLLAQGYTIEETANQVGITDRTLYRWRNDLEFMAEVDRLTLMVGIASRSERLRIAMQVIRQKLAKENVDEQTKRDLLDWLKFVQSETDGAKFDLALVFEAMEKTARDSEAD
jgi:transposase-like protein